MSSPAFYIIFIFPTVKSLIYEYPYYMNRREEGFLKSFIFLKLLSLLLIYLGYESLAAGIFPLFPNFFQRVGLTIVITYIATEFTNRLFLLALRYKKVGAYTHEYLKLKFLSDLGYAIAISSPAIVRAIVS